MTHKNNRYLLFLWCGRNVSMRNKGYEIVFSDKTKLISILQQKYYLKIFVHQILLHLLQFLELNFQYFLSNLISSSDKQRNGEVITH